MCAHPLWKSFLSRKTPGLTFGCIPCLFTACTLTRSIGEYTLHHHVSGKFGYLLRVVTPRVAPSRRDAMLHLGKTLPSGGHLFVRSDYEIPTLRRNPRIAIKNTVSTRMEVWRTEHSLITKKLFAEVLLGLSNSGVSYAHHEIGQGQYTFVSLHAKDSEFL